MRRLTWKTELRGLLTAREGATAIEYALIASGISIAILTGVTTLGNGIMTVFYDKLTQLF